MVLRPLTPPCLVALLLLSLAAGGATAAPAPSTSEPEPGEVTLPLRDYLALVEKVEAIEREQAGEVAHREAPVAEIVTQHTSVAIDPQGERKDRMEGEATVTARFEALVQGHPNAPLYLPFDGFAVRSEVHQISGKPAPAGASPAAIAASRASGQPGLLLVAPEPGRYAIEVSGRAAFDDREGVRRLLLAPVAAPVAEVELDLPAELAWNVPGAVVVEEHIAGGRRTVRLAARRGEAQTLELRRHLDGTEAEKLLAQSVVLTLFQLRPDGVRRHDVVLYEVSRGSLDTLSVDLPADLSVEQVATDEGDVVPVVEARHLTVHRRRQLTGIGYLVLTSAPRSETVLAAQGVVPAVEVRARYLALASSVAAEAEPRPVASWSRVDLTDLPPALGQALQSLDLTAAWRLATEPQGEPVLAVAFLPPAPQLPTLVRRRETTTLLTPDGTVLHRDRFTLDQAGSAFDLTLPAGAVLWSAKVGDQPVRPVERGGGLSIPLGFTPAGDQPVVEVISVLERKIPRGRSELALDLPQVASPVVEHLWRLLLPEGPRYRFRRGELLPARESGRDGSDAFATSAPATPTVTLHDRAAAGKAGLSASVVDEHGAALPGVTVTLTSPILPRPIVAVTQANGSIRGMDLPPGTYALKAELEGFSTVDWAGVEVPPDKLVQVQLMLSPNVEETITVTAESPLNPRALYRDQERLKKAADEMDQRDAFRKEAEELKQGLVGGVKPLPITIPESGKALLLTGALPPARIGVELEIKGKS
jgi:hypothetical protein